MTDDDPQPTTQKPFYLGLGLLLFLAAWLRLEHLETSWSFWSMDYLSYYGPIRDDVGTGPFPWRRLVGLHPPQHALLVTGVLAWGGSVAQVIWLSVGLSLGAIVLAALALRQIASPRAALIVATLLACSPYQVHYGVELNNYPLFLFGGAALVWAAARAWSQDTSPPGLLVILAVAASLTLHGHLAGLPLVGVLLTAFAVRRRWTAVGALGVGLLTFLPVGLAMKAMLGGATTFHNDPLLASELAVELPRAWIGRFGSAASLGAAIACVLASGVLGLLSPRTRHWTLGGVLVLAVAVLTVLVGMRSGAAQVAQTPYWIFASWTAWLLVGIGWEGAGRAGRILLAVLILAWAAGSGIHAAAPPPTSTQGASVETASALAGHLERTASRGDAVVYLWDPSFLNDDPVSHDPLFAIFEASELQDWTGRDAPCRNYGFHWGERLACFRPSASLRGGEHEEALTRDVSSWITQGRTVHLIQANIDPRRAPPDPARLKAAVARLGGVWREARPGGLRVYRIRPPEALAQLRDSDD